jgi:hypothetical protein
MNAQLKPNEQAALDVRLAQRRADVFEIDGNRAKRAERREALQDEIQDTVHCLLDDILANHAAGDDLANGEILSRIIGAYGMRLSYHRISNELRDAFLPSSRSMVEP